MPIASSTNVSLFVSMLTASLDSDSSFAGISSTSEENLEEQTRNYRVITDIVLNNDNCPYMVIWGIKDNDSWRSASNPLLYTSGLSKKPAWKAVRSALRHNSLTTGIEAPRMDIPDSSKESTQRIEDRRKVNYRLTNLLPREIYIKDGKKLIGK